MTQIDERREDWDAYRKLVIESLERLDNSMKQLTRDLAAEIKGIRTDELQSMHVEIITLRVDVATLKTKAAMIGAAAGFVMAGLVSFAFKSLGGP